MDIVDLLAASSSLNEPANTGTIAPDKPTGRQDGGRFLSPKDAAAYACVSVNLIYHWCNEKLLPHFRLGENGRRGKIVIDVSDVEQFLASRKVGGQPMQVTLPPKAKPIKPRFRHLKL